MPSLSAGSEQQGLVQSKAEHVTLGGERAHRKVGVGLPGLILEQAAHCRDVAGYGGARARVGGSKGVSIPLPEDEAAAQQTRYFDTGNNLMQSR